MADQVNLTVSLAPGLPMAGSPAKPNQPLPAPIAPAVAGREASASAKASTPAEVASAAQVFSDFLQQTQPDLVFQVDRATHEPYFKVVDAKTRKVIRQVPSEEVLAMAHKLRELAHAMGASGVLVDQQG
jgi:flagellar protein FlaG